MGTDEADNMRHHALVLDYTVFKADVANKFALMSTHLKYLQYLIGLQVACLILLLGGEKGLKLIQALGFLP